MRYWLPVILLLFPLVVLSEESVLSPTIQEVKRSHEAELMALPGVVSVGIGLDENGKPAIIVGLDKERQETRVKMPRTLAGHPVIIQITGTIKAQ